MKISAPAFPGSLLVDELDVSSLPKGAVSRLRLALVHDGLGRPVRLPVLVAVGKRPGPVFGITAALHGNELNGMPVIHQLFDKLDVNALSGTVVGVVAVNIPAILNHERKFADGTDLNHIMPGRADGNAPSTYAFRLIDRVIKHFDYLADLHTASFGRVNSLYVRADMNNPDAAQMAYLQRPRIIVHNPPSDRTLRGAVASLGVPAITVEIGNPQRFQRDYIRRATAGLLAILAHAGMIKRRARAPGEPPELCESSEWMYTDHGGLLEVLPELAERVTAEQVIARMTSVYGDLVHEYRASHDAIVIGKSVNPVSETGARIAHLGVIAPEGHSFQRRRSPSNNANRSER